MQQPPHFFSYVRRARPFTIVEGTPKPIKVSYLKSLPGFVSPMGLLSPRMWISATHRNAPARGSHGSYPGHLACQRALNIAPKHIFLSYETLLRRRKENDDFENSPTLISVPRSSLPQILVGLLAYFTGQCTVHRRRGFHPKIHILQQNIALYLQDQNHVSVDEIKPA